MSFLAGRKFFIVGGNGFVGNRLAATLIRHGAEVTAFSRTGSRFQYPQNDKIKWLCGDIMKAEEFKKQINEADTIVHSMAALIDTVVKNKTTPGGPGSYEQMNRDSFYKLLSTLESPKKIFYVSAVGHPPFIPRYETTKKQAQEKLLKSNHDGYIIRPGFIYDPELKKWSPALRSVIRLWNQIYPLVNSLTPKILEPYLLEFKQSEPTKLDHIAESIVYLSQATLNSGETSPQRIFQNESLVKFHYNYEQLCRSSK